MIEKPCVKCGKLFVQRKDRPNQKFCSIQCVGRAKHITPPTFICANCGAVKDRRKYTGQNSRTGYDYGQKFCSKECGWKGRKWRPISETGHKTQSGYIRINIRGGGHTYKHRLVMEQILGRPLLKHENVHHKDGDGFNNSPNNIELWTKKQPPGQRVTDKVTYAIEILRLYPEFAKAQGVMLVDCDH